MPSREGNKESPGQDTGYPGGSAKSLEEYGPNYGKTAQLRWSASRSLPPPSPPYPQTVALRQLSRFPSWGINHSAK